MINLNEQIEKAKEEFKNGNYEESIKCIDGVDSSDDYYEIAQFIKSSCLLKLKQYKESLLILNDLISKTPYEVLLWIDKLYCHIFLKEDEKAARALDEIDRLADKTDKSLLVQIARLSYLVGDYDMVLKYCDYALAIDPDFKEAWYEKASVLMELGDDKETNHALNRIRELSDNDLLGTMPVFLMNLFSKNYRTCVDLISNVNQGEVDDEHMEMLKGMIYKQICDDNNACLLIVNAQELPIDDVLDVMIDFVETGKDYGEINKIHYFII